ncbi:MAG: class I SAM-dependent methyltransferase [Pirellulales bacterium]
MCKHKSWSRLYKSRRAVAARFGGVFELPLVKHLRHVLLDAVRDGDAVLEVGAGDRRMKRFLEARRARIDYASMDVDPEGEHDFRDLAEIQRAYDCVFALEVIEHLEFNEIGPWLSRLAELLKPGGRLLLSTPNVYRPGVFLSDATHRTPLGYDVLGGMVELTGLQVERIVRVYNDPLHRMVLRRFVFGWLFRLLGIDFARQIVLVAWKPEA